MSRIHAPAMDPSAARPPAPAVLGITLLALLLAAPPASAQAQRDPTLPPAGVRPASPTATPAGNPAPAPRQLIVVDGRRWVVDNGRRRGPGDLLGDGRIERIDDDAVVVKGPSGLQRLPLYPGVVKRPANEAPRPTDTHNRAKP